MKDKINDKRIKKALTHFLVSQKMLFLISAILFVTESTLSRPLYINVLGLGELLGSVLALGMAVLFAFLPKVAAKLFAQKNYGLGLVAICCGLGLLSFIYIGQAEVARQLANDPLPAILEVETDTETKSNLHVVATSLIALLYMCSVFLGYLFYRDESEFHDTKFGLSMSKLGRAFQYKLLPLFGRFQRAEAKPKIIAEGRVNEHIKELENKESELQHELDLKKAARNFELAVLTNARNRISHAIETAYSTDS